MCPNHEAAAINIGREEPTLSGRSAPKFRASRADRPLVRQVSTQILPFLASSVNFRTCQELPESERPDLIRSGGRCVILKPAACGLFRARNPQSVYRLSESMSSARCWFTKASKSSRNV